MPDPSSLLLHPREASRRIEVTPETAGWEQLSFRVDALRPGASAAYASGDEELCLVLLGGACRVTTDGSEYRLEGRSSPFDGLPIALYLPCGTAFGIESDGADVAICGARASERHAERLITPREVEVEVRGAGNATRQINHILPPAFPAQRLLVVEVLTPAGNWSSYPPHKHELERLPVENALEEVYYYRVARPEGFGVQRLYSRDGSLDETWTVRDGDCLLVPRGYHPFAAGHGFDCYYLNALAGDARSMAAEDDPDLAWVRDTWPALAPDPRVPLVAAS